MYPPSVYQSAKSSKACVFFACLRSSLVRSLASGGVDATWRSQLLSLRRRRDKAAPSTRRAQRLVSPRRHRREEGSAPRAHHKVVAPSVGEDCCSERDGRVVRVVGDVNGALGDL